MYKLTENSIQKLSDGISIPQDANNRDYQQFLKDVKVNSISIVTGADIIAPDYVALRTGADGYASTGDQLGMIAVGGTTHADHVAAVKTAFPKSNIGGTTIAAIPSWVQTAADELLFSEQLVAYKNADDRLAQYIVSAGRAEVTATRVIGQDPVLDSDGLPTYTEAGVAITTDITETYVSVTAIAAVDPTVEYVTEAITGNTTSTIENPLITYDVLARTAAQVIVDATPQPVIDHI